MHTTKISDNLILQYICLNLIFIPSNRVGFLKKIPSIKADHFVIDFEDSVTLSEWDKCVTNLQEYGDVRSHYFRPNLWYKGSFTTNALQELAEVGVKIVVLPKLKILEQVREIIEMGKYSKVILLVETPDLLLILPDVVKQYHSLIECIGFVSQDFAMYTNMKQSLLYMNYALFQINLTASKFGKKCIDTASMLMDDEDVFGEECINAFNMGCSGKFIIHPRQLQVLSKTEYFSQSEIA
jgi:citrate lyase subunit beta/citryl-CoA lyase